MTPETQIEPWLARGLGLMVKFSGDNYQNSESFATADVFIQHASMNYVYCSELICAVSQCVTLIDKIKAQLNTINKLSSNLCTKTESQVKRQV